MIALGAAVVAVASVAGTDAALVAVAGLAVVVAAVVAFVPPVVVPVVVPVAERSAAPPRSAEAGGASDEAACAALVRGNARLRALSEISGAFAMVELSYQALLDQIAQVVADLVGDGCSITLVSDDAAQLHNAANAHRDPALALHYQAFLARTPVAAASPAVTATVIRTGQSQRAEVAPGEMVARSEPALRPMVERLNVHSFAVVPMRARKTVIGALSLLRSRPGVGYSDDDVTLLQDLADRAGLAIEYARLYSRLEDRVRERTVELEHANEELEAFSHSAAHDLRAPLRAIAGFSEILAHDYGDRLDAEGRDHLETIRSAAARMGHLIDDLLNLSRIGRMEVRRQRVALSELAHAVVDRLRSAEPGRTVEVIVEDGLIAQADARLLEIALTNLLGNAWKFTGKRERARIEIAARPAAAPEGPITYLVRDNGVGFDATHAGKLFGVFERLHSEQEFEGTGLGLATVQRVIHHHGGRIWAEGHVGRGATFFFTLESDAHAHAQPPAG